jgi:BirA family biotin operon repressor/biotin-[acetyl-CoA-carboxylase] ligase
VRRTELNKETIRKYLKSDYDTINIYTLQETTSTNDDAKKILPDQAEEVVLVATNKQTAGRGRHGKSFYSELDQGLYFSLAFTPRLSETRDFPLYTVLAAAALVKVMEKYVSDPVSIKWVNDIFYHGRKVSGILSEMGMNLKTNHTPYIIVGVGINFAGDFDQTNRDVQNVAGTLFGRNTPAHFNQNEFLAAFVKQFMEYHAAFSEKKFLTVYEEHLLGLGKTVFYTRNGEKQSGIIKGINENGHLLVLTENQKEEALFSQTIEFGSEQFIDFESSE